MLVTKKEAFLEKGDMEVRKSVFSGNRKQFSTAQASRVAGTGEQVRQEGGEAAHQGLRKKGSGKVYPYPVLSQFLRPPK